MRIYTLFLYIAAMLVSVGIVLNISEEVSGSGEFI